MCPRLIAKDPKERYPDADALIEELKGVLRSLGDEDATVVDRAPLSESVTQKEELAETSTTIQVPTLIGQSVFQASDTLAEAGLALGAQEEISSETAAEGKIISQSPEAGTEVEAGSSVSVTVSTGPSTVEVPDLDGLSHSEVSTALAAAGLKLGRQNEVPSETVPEGEVMDQAPAAGTKAKRGSSVSVTVSRGSETVRVPDLTDQDAALAVIR